MQNFSICEKKKEKRRVYNISPSTLVDNSSERTKKKIHESFISELLSNGMLWVHLDNEDLILGYVSGRIRRSFFIHILL
uniref:InfA n=3 Tax=Ulmus TaxID=24735 RepID=A0A518QWP6_ULMAM|nr:InfA [Ulmus americana]QDX14892.1 InfA [Ulmus americana]QEG79031.1 InfA [Ulmus americana]